MSGDPEKQTARNMIGKGKPGPGRKPGVPNKTTTALKDMILGALDKAGGVDYLVSQAEKNPAAFLTLVGKVIPLDVNANVAGKIIGMPSIIIGRVDE